MEIYKIKQQSCRHSIRCAITIKEPFIAISKYSDFNKLQRFYHNLKFPNKKQIDHLTSRELIEALESIIRSVQQESFSKEIKQIQKVCGLPKQIEGLKSFLRYKGFIENRRKIAALCFHNKKFSIIVPYDHRVTEIIVKNEPVKLLHCGHEQILATLRCKYWIFSGAKFTKKDYS